VREASAPEEAVIRIEDVTVRYPGADHDAVRSVSLEVRRGELLALVGGSGSGKSTTLLTINAMVRPRHGRVLVDGRSVLDEDPVVLRRRIGFVLQSVGLFPHMTVAENVAVVPRLLGWTKDRVEARVGEMLRLVRLDPDVFGERMPDSLSGGQRQRVGVARALAAESRVLLMDEPFGALDAITRSELQDELSGLQRSLELTTVMVTHDMTEALLLADRVAVMRGGELISSGTPADLLDDPPDDYTASLLDAPRDHAARIAALAGSTTSGAGAEATDA